MEVNSKSLDVFEQIFGTRAVARGKLKWENFRAAMLDTGCSMTRGGLGSAVTFRNLEGKGSIGFHEPHNNVEIRSSYCRGKARRLTNKFGWTEDSFVERQKGEETQAP
ncbi:unnamed protein product [Zymoseptoria tritici ST99CH_3D1]|nr:unnamed protein product [Zymoseptoria tritici ST99CH_1E4]SMR45538.1 unnamed protein product [Zymoseptoria tritici ST99CH_3D1]